LTAKKDVLPKLALMFLHNFAFCVNRLFHFPNSGCLICVRLRKCCNILS